MAAAFDPDGGDFELPAEGELDRPCDKDGVHDWAVMDGLAVCTIGGEIGLLAVIPLADLAGAR